MAHIPRVASARAAVVVLSAVVAVTALLAIIPASATVSPANSVGVGSQPVAIAVDAAARTAYVTVAGDQVAVIDTAKCTYQVSAACTGSVAVVNLESGAGAAGLAYDAVNHSVYVADSDTGDLSVIDASTCNARTTTGCAATVPLASIGLTAPSAVAVDTSGGADAVYVSDLASGSVSVFSGATCNASVQSGCGTSRNVDVGAEPDAIVVAPTLGTVYVANRASASVTTLNEAACAKLATACSTAGRTVPLEVNALPVALVADAADNTVFVADSGTGRVSFLNTARCTIAVNSGCSTTPRTESGLGATGIAMTSEGDIAVADSAHDRAVSFAAATCDATTTTGCTSKELDPLAGTPAALATNGVTIYAADVSNASVDIVATPSLAVSVKSAHRESSFGWYRSPVTVSFHCAAGSGSLTTSCHAPAKVTSNTKGKSISAALTAADGGRVEATVTVRLDQTKPTLKIQGVKNGKTYAKHPTFHCVAKDALSGLASCVTTRIKHQHGHLVDYTATAIDKAGNVRRQHGRFRIS
jgi:DNA-binding beta-propeller fold protein YncE